MKDYSYVETIVKKEETAKSYAIRVLMILAAVITFFISFINIITTILFIVVIVAILYFFPKLKVDYEYVFVDGQMDFDKILGGNKRKTELRIEFDDIEVMAPHDSPELNRFGHLELKTKNFTSRKKDAPHYVVIYLKGNEVYRILFEPSEQMVEAIRRKVPRKLVRN